MSVHFAFAEIGFKHLITVRIRNACVCTGPVRMAKGAAQVVARDQGWRGEQDQDVQGNNIKKTKKDSAALTLIS